MRLIDADAVKNIKFKCAELVSTPEARQYQQGWNDALDAVAETAPTIDAEPIVHCSECKHGKWLARCNNVLQCDFDVFGQICLDGDDYCSWGEKKDEVTE